MLITVGLLQACASFRPQFPFQVPRADRDSGSSRYAAGGCDFCRCWTIPARGAQTWVSGCSTIVEACDRCGGRVQCGDEEWRGFGGWVDGWVKRAGRVGGMKLFIVCRRCLCRTALLSLLWKPRCPNDITCTSRLTARSLHHLFSCYEILHELVYLSHSERRYSLQVF